MINELIKVITNNLITRLLDDRLDLTSDLISLITHMIM
jgi:hypothetical protein